MEQDSARTPAGATATGDALISGLTHVPARRVMSVECWRALALLRPVNMSRTLRRLAATRSFVIKAIR